MFEEFYMVYPKKANKKEAEDLFAKLSPDLQKKAINDVLYRKENHGPWLRGNEFIPNPARYIRRELWNDEVIEKQTKEKQLQNAEDGSELSRFWTLLVQVYGERFRNAYGDTMPWMWKRSLQGITKGEIARILKYLETDQSEFIPDLPKINRIRRIGQDLKIPKQKLIGNPTKPETLEQSIKEMMECLK